MSFVDSVLPVLKGLLPQILVMQGLLIPFVILEQLLPAGARPRLGDYILNILISLTTLVLTLPLSVFAGAGGAYVREKLGLTPFGFSFGTLGEIPHVGGALEILAILAATMVLHDLWFYWSHRIEHKVPFLWEFHKLHHSDERMSSSTWARDHFLQSVWRSIFPAFTFGLVLQLEVQEAGQVGLYAALLTSLLSMFYHSGVRLHLPWMNRVLVTPQVHRIHHSTDPKHHDKNFADFLPIFDIVFGTYHAPQRNEFPETGLGREYKAPKNVFSAQIRPVIGAVRTLLPKSRARANREAV